VFVINSGLQARSPAQVRSGYRSSEGTQSDTYATLRGLKGPGTRLFRTLIVDRGNEKEAQEMGLAGMVFSLIGIAAGAIMTWGVTTTQGHGFRLSTVGVIFMVVGAVGLVGSSVIFATSRRPAGNGRRTFDRQVTDTAGRTALVHEEVR
jgi:hypothetical protein